MTVGELCNAPVFVAEATQPLAAAAAELRDHDVGALVVVELRNSEPCPVGILTDRDIVCGQVDHSADLHCLTVGDVMTRDPLTVAADSDVFEAIGAMSERRVRRAPVVGRSGELVGIVTLDDILPAVADELRELAGILQLQAARAHS